jgi:hypothetical protein
MSSVQPVDLANLATSIVLISTSSIPIVVSLRTKAPKIAAQKKGVRVSQISTMLLGLFLLIHGLYHAAEFIGNDFFSDDILEPLSILLLLIFSFYVKKFIFVPRLKSPKNTLETASSISPEKTTRAKLGHRRIFPITIIPVTIMTLSTYVGSILQFPAEIFTLVGILISASLFAWMAIQNPSFHSVHFEFAIIVLIWAAAEIPHSLSSLGVISVVGIDFWGTWIHFVSMFFIVVFVCLRTVKIALFQPTIRMKG